MNVYVLFLDRIFVIASSGGGLGILDFHVVTSGNWVVQNGFLILKGVPFCC